MDVARFLVAAAMLIGASVWDLRERRIPNLYWFPFVVFAGAFVAVDVDAKEWLHLLGATFVAILSYLFWRFGLWGGADAKGVMLLSFMVRENLQPSATPAVLDSLATGLPLVLLLPIGLTVWNLAKGNFAFPAMLIGRPVPIQVAKARRVWPMQDADGWRFKVKIGEDMHSVYRGLETAGKQQVWVTMQLPAMVFIAAGYFIANLVGSPVELFMRMLRP